MGYNPQESLENTTNAMGTLLGVHPIVPRKHGPPPNSAPQTVDVHRDTWRL